MPPAALWTMWTSWTLWTAIFGFRVHVVHAVHIVRSSATFGAVGRRVLLVPAAYAAGYVPSPLRGSPPSRQPALPSRLAPSRRPTPREGEAPAEPPCHLTQAIARLKTIWSLVAAGIALVVAAL